MTGTPYRPTLPPKEGYVERDGVYVKIETELEQTVQKVADIVLIDPAKMTLEQYKTCAVETLKDRIDTILTAGIEYEERIFNASKEKQDLLANQLGLYMMNSQLGNPDVLTWNTKDGVCEEWSFDKLLDLANAIKAYAQPMVKRQQEAEIRIREASDREQIETILQDFM